MLAAAMSGSRARSFRSRSRLAEPRTGRSALQRMANAPSARFSTAPSSVCSIRQKFPRGLTFRPPTSASSTTFRTGRALPSSRGILSFATFPHLRASRCIRSWISSIASLTLVRGSRSTLTGAIPSVTSATRFPRSSSSTFGPSGSLRTFRSGSGLPSSRCNTFSRLRRSACLLRICLAPLRRFSLSVGAVPYSGNRASLKVFDGAGGSGYGRLAPNCRKL